MSDYKLALVLGGGAARGMAHLGVLKVFAEEGLTFDLVVGTSVGSLIGAVYALGLPLDEAEQSAKAFTWQHLVDVTVPTMGFNAGERLEQVVRRSIKGLGFEDLRIPLAVVTTDIEEGEPVIFQSGDLAKVIRASCSIPGVFAPVRIGGRLLVDGGLRQTVPVSIARQLGADAVIAVDVGFCVQRGPMTNILQIIYQATQIIGQELNNYQILEADVAIRPSLGNIDQMAFDRAPQAVAKGWAAADAVREEIRRYVRHAE